MWYSASHISSPNSKQPLPIHSLIPNLTCTEIPSWKWNGKFEKVNEMNGRRKKSIDTKKEWFFKSIHFEMYSESKKKYTIVIDVKE